MNDDRITLKKCMFAMVVLTPLITSPLFATTIKPSPTTDLTHSESNIRKILLHFYQHWQGVPYALGGNSKRGVDCSGFVFIAFRDALSMAVPRSTSHLSMMNYSISRDDLRAGDILIFNMADNDLHAGIYVGNNQFIHASKSKIVALTDFTKLFWVKVYKKSIGVIDYDRMNMK